MIGPQASAEPPRAGAATPSLLTLAREWGRIGCIGFGGPPAHIALLRELCVERRAWLTSPQFERAIAATNLLPGPSSTQLAIYCAWRLRGTRGALLGGLCFIVPGLAAIIALAVLFLAGSPPAWARAAGAGAGAAVAAVAVKAGLVVGLPIWEQAARPDRRARVLAYGLAGALAAALLGAWLVLVLLACGAVELALERRSGWPLLALGAKPGGLWALAWTALKIGALAFGGGFVIVPLMLADAVGTYHWMSHSQFLNAVALGQLTPGPVVQTVAVVGYAAAGLPGALLAGAVAFAPSFSFVLLGGARFERLLGDPRVRAFLAGAAPGAAGAIVGAAVPLAGALAEGWQYAVLAGAAVVLLAFRRGIVTTLLLAGGAGLLAALAGAPIPA
ncbi:MAG TPA: chromate efflux transporter [Solirubrobacteraceae bacterium]|nr:chromate efflux transporter [Solirubrobacteraceae bacterium]